ncbi:hypothetical protein ZIOFF_048204 [Zingiber officinale]|uniref:C2H2-type domain-containing protein n=1 Tax=Zingiber officinale TaxID=94328 RepID=A0A8J5FZE0_ZINOF|nr:hypothetical protein ZIOFF_048204 [Zingiber officinale]
MVGDVLHDVAFFCPLLLCSRAIHRLLYKGCCYCTYISASLICNMKSGSYSSCTISSPEGEGINLLEATTWPPRSYPCAFCRRGFKSAQALGGHMNVHRRDRALLRRQRPESCPSAATASPPYSVVIPTQPQPELVAPGGVFLLYPIALASPPSYFSGAGRRSSESTLCSDGVSKEGGEELDLELRLG